jgi:hypothetical protein
MAVKLVLFLFILFFSSISFSSGMVLDFTDGMKNICSKNNSVLLSKKMFLTILKLEKQGKYPCEDEDMKKLVLTCIEDNSCEKVLKVYKDVVYKYEGKVLGQ